MILRSHDGPVTGLSLHPTGDYVLSTSTDQHWAFSDIRTGTLLTKVPLIFTTLTKFSSCSSITKTAQGDSLICVGLKLLVLSCNQVDSAVQVQLYFHTNRRFLKTFGSLSGIE